MVAQELEKLDGCMMCQLSEHCIQYMSALPRLPLPHVVAGALVL